jgi:hypothetical protein
MALLQSMLADMHCMLISDRLWNIDCIDRLLHWASRVVYIVVPNLETKKPNRDRSRLQYKTTSHSLPATSTSTTRATASPLAYAPVRPSASLLIWMWGRGCVLEYMSVRGSSPLQGIIWRMLIQSAFPVEVFQKFAPGALLYLLRSLAISLRKVDSKSQNRLNIAWTILKIMVDMPLVM